MSAIAKPLFTPAREKEAEDPKEHLMHDPMPRGNELDGVGFHAFHYMEILDLDRHSCVHCSDLLVCRLVLPDHARLGSSGGKSSGLLGNISGRGSVLDRHQSCRNLHLGNPRVLKVESRRPFTRAAELMTTFGLVQAGISVFLHMGRVWLSYWLLPFPNERGLWPDFHSPLMWDFMAINTYLICSTMYLFLPLIPDLAMACDRSTGWRKTFYKILAIGFRGTEGEWKNLKTAMNIFAFAIIPVMFSVHTIVSWDFAMATRPGWSSTVFGPYFVIGALQSGMAAVAIVLFMIRSTMKNMKYFLRPEHFETLGMLMFLVSLAWAYFYFNDYLVPWYGGDMWDKILNTFIQTGPLWYLWYGMLFCNLAPLLILWNKRWRRIPWLLASLGFVINIGMWLERYVIIPETLTINRMPFTWRIYVPHIEIVLTIGNFALFFLLYLLASRMIPLIPVWEVQEGQESHILRKIGKAKISTVSDID